MANYGSTRRGNDPENQNKGVMLVLGGIVALGAGFFVFSYVFALLFLIFKATLALGMIGGGLYLGYKVLNRPAALPGHDERSPRALSAGDDYERKMRELDRMEKALDAEISRR